MPLPVLPARRILQRLLQCGAELVDRVVKPGGLISCDVLLHRSGKFSEELPVVRRRNVEIGRMIKRQLARGKIRGVMPPAGVRPHRINAAPPIAKQGTRDISGGVLKRSEQGHLRRMLGQAKEKIRHLLGAEMIANVARDQKHFVGEYIDPKRRAAQRTSFAASHLHLGALGDLIEMTERRSCRPIKLAGRRACRDVGGKFLSRIFVHFWL